MTTTTGAAPMSAAQVLAVLGRDAMDAASWHAIAMDRELRAKYAQESVQARAAVSAMAEREAALVAAFEKQGIAARETQQAAHDARVELATATARIAAFEAEVEALRAELSDGWVAHLVKFIGPGAIPGLRKSFAEGRAPGGARHDAARAEAGKP